MNSPESSHRWIRLIERLTSHDLRRNARAGASASTRTPRRSDCRDGPRAYSECLDRRMMVAVMYCGICVEECPRCTRVGDDLTQPASSSHALVEEMGQPS